METNETPKKKKKVGRILGILVAIIIVCGAAGFFGYTTYQSSQLTTQIETAKKLVLNNPSATGTNCKKLQAILPKAGENIPVSITKKNAKAVDMSYLIKEATEEIHKSEKETLTAQKSAYTTVKKEIKALIDDDELTDDDQTIVKSLENLADTYQAIDDANGLKQVVSDLNKVDQAYE